MVDNASVSGYTNIACAWMHLFCCFRYAACEAKNYTIQKEVKQNADI